MPQLPPLSHWAIASQSGLACAGAAAMANGAPTATPAMTARATARVAACGLQCLPRFAIMLSLPAADQWKLVGPVTRLPVRKSLSLGGHFGCPVDRVRRPGIRCCLLVGANAKRHYV